MKRENLEKRPYCTIIASSDFPFYAAPEADAVMDAMEARIMELESEVIGYKASLERANFNMCEKDALIKELESDNARLKSIVDDEEYKDGLSGLAKRNAELRDENARLKDQVPKWISVKDRLPSNQERVFGLVVGTDLVTKDWTPELNERIKRTELCYYVDGDGWYSSEGYQMVVSPRMWMPLPPPPTAEESSVTEKENE